MAVAADTRFAAFSCGSRHPDTLTSIYNLGTLLKDQGDLEGAATLFREDFEGCAERLGRSDKETLRSARNLIKILQKMGASEEADALAATYSL